MSSRYFPNGSLPPGALKVSRLGKIYASKISWLRRLSARHGNDELEEGDVSTTTSEVEDEPASDRVWALKDINFSISPGERVAVLGSPGAGKSTLINLLAGVLTPSEGTVEGSGITILLSSVAAPIAPRRTGYENLLMLSDLLRVPRERVIANLDRIVEFSELGDHLHKEVQKYSSSMFQRLGLSLALNISPDILLVDEGIKARDPKFYQKATSRIAELVEGGMSLIFATSSDKRVRALCTRGIVLESSALTFDGSFHEAFSYYLRTDSQPMGLVLPKVEDLQLDEADPDEIRRHLEEIGGHRHDDAADNAMLIARSDEGAIPDTLSAMDVVINQLERRLGVAFLKKAKSLLSEGDRTGAIQAYDESLAIQRKLAARVPADSDCQYELSLNLIKIADVKLKTGDFAGAVELYEESSRIHRSLLDVEGRTTESLRNLSKILSRIHDARLETDRAGALTALEESIGFRRKLVAADGDDGRSQIALVIGLRTLARASRDEERVRTWLEEARRLLLKLEARELLSTGQKEWRAEVEAELKSLTFELAK